jgi:hypothetical protein
MLSLMQAWEMLLDQAIASLASRADTRNKIHRICDKKTHLLSSFRRPRLFDEARLGDKLDDKLDDNALEYFDDPFDVSEVALVTSPDDPFDVSEKLAPFIISEQLA